MEKEMTLKIEWGEDGISCTSKWHDWEEEIAILEMHNPDLIKTTWEEHVECIIKDYINSSLTTIGNEMKS